MSEDTSEIHRAVMDGKPLLVEKLLSEDPKLALLKDQDGRTPLHWAVSFQNPQMVRSLLNPNGHKLKVDIDDLQDDSGWTPLHIAASVGDLELFKQFMALDPQPDVDLQTSTGQTCLHYAVSKGHYDLVEYLLKECKASARIKDKKRQYPLHRAAANGSLRMVQWLVELGKSPLSPKDAYGWTPLHHALSEGHGDVALYLVKQGADQAAEDTEGKTPIDVVLNDKVKQFFERGLGAAL